MTELQRYFVSTVSCIALLSGCGGGGGGGGGDSIDPISTAVDDAYNVGRNESLSVNSQSGVLANDALVQNSQAIVLLETQPLSSAQFTLNADGSFQYLHNGDNASTDSFTYRINDGSNVSNIATVTLQIFDTAPVANPDGYAVNQGDTLVVDAVQGVLANDTDPQSDPLTAILVADVAEGTLNLNPDGSFTYVHTSGTSADDSFTYMANDGTHNSGVATVTFQVNAAPVTSAFCDSISVSPDTLTGDLRDHVTDPDGTNFTFSVLQDGSNGMTTLESATGIFEYSPDPGFRGADSFSYQVQDDLGATATGSIQVVVGDTRIMPTGDSITSGITISGLPTSDERIGYRKKLYDDLAAAGLSVDFVGGIQEGLSAGIIDPDHEGYPGARDDEFADPMDVKYIQILLANNLPDIILLHIGSNDVNANEGGSADTSADDVAAILQDIQTWEDANTHPVTVFLAQILDRETQFNGLPNPDVDTFNTNITNAALTRINNLGDDIILVDMHNALDYPSDFTPGQVTLVHPNQTGYDKMADTWHGALVASGKIPMCP